MTKTPGPMRIASLAFAAALAACSDGSGPTATLVADAGDPDAASAADAGPPPDTWTAVYAAYFGRGTPGHCGNAGCHAILLNGFQCGPTKDTCYQGLVNASLVSLKDPASSPLVDRAQSPLAWFGGLMPQDNQAPNAAAAAAVKAWITAGAKND